jgi:HSP20 family protein
MKTYACYPKARTRFHAPAFGFFNPYSSSATQPEEERINRPSANIIREESGYKIQLAVPGLTKDQIKIELNDDQLVITGPAVDKETQLKYVRKEFDSNGFKRVFRLHKNANAAAMTASFEHGILTIVIPDAAPETVKINIQ